MSARKGHSEHPPEPGVESRKNRLKQFLERDIWEYGVGEDHSLKGQWVALLRILSISWKGLFGNRLFSRAAALSYSSLLALGPVVAIAVIISSSFVESNPEAQIKRALLFIAPSLQEMVTIPAEAGLEAGESEMATALDTLITQIVVGAQELMGRINTGGSKAFGLFGAFILIWVVIQLLTSIETTLNQIWGVHQGRPWGQRIVYYWTFVSLGALLGLGSTALLSASNLASLFEWVPFGQEVTGVMIRFSPLLSFLMLVLLLMLFYRFFPNTSVSFKPALVGALLTAALLFTNNYLSILYVHRVISIQSFYGSVGIIPVLMIGLYFFWIFILLGGQITYAVQNVSFLANQAAWQRISPKVRELVTLAVFLRIARNFRNCQGPPTVTDLSNELHIPVNILNECLEMLEASDWVAQARIEDERDDRESTGYRPARPLEAYDLGLFRETMENYGRSEMVGHLLREDELLQRYREILDQQRENPLFGRNLNELLGN